MRDMIFPVPRLLKFLAKHVSLAPGGCRNEATIGVRYPSNRHTSARIDAYTHAHARTLTHAHAHPLTPTRTSPLPVQQGTCSSPEHRSVNCNAPSRTHTRCTHTHTSFPLAPNTPSLHHHPTLAVRTTLTRTLPLLPDTSPDLTPWVSGGRGANQSGRQFRTALGPSIRLARQRPVSTRGYESLIQ